MPAPRLESSSGPGVADATIAKRRPVDYVDRDVVSMDSAGIPDRDGCFVDCESVPVEELPELTVTHLGGSVRTHLSGESTSQPGAARVQIADAAETQPLAWPLMMVSMAFLVLHIGMARRR